MNNRVPFPALVCTGFAVGAWLWVSLQSGSDSAEPSSHKTSTAFNRRPSRQQPVCRKPTLKAVDAPYDCTSKSTQSPEYASAATPDIHQEAFKNELWERGASQVEFYHAPFKRPLVPNDEDLDPESFVPREEVKRAYGFGEWPRFDYRLIGGVAFSPTECRGLADFVMVHDESTACFRGPINHHGVLREIRLRRNADQCSVSIDLLVALSAETAQEMLVPIIRSGYPVGMRISVSGLALGDVSYAGYHQTGEFKSISFTRHNVYFSIRADSCSGGDAAGGVNLLAIAQDLDRTLVSAPLASLEEINQMRPRIASFQLGKERLRASGKEEDGECGVSYRVVSPTGLNFTVFADGTGDLQYDDRAKPRLLSARESGLQIARLVVIDDHLLFTWADIPVQVDE